MAVGYTRAYCKKMVEHLGHKTELPMPVPWLAILNAEPLGTVGDVTAKEAKWTGYARVKIEGASWNAAVEGAIVVMTNVSLIEIPFSSGEDSVGWTALCDAATVGKAIILGLLPELLKVDTGHSPLKFEPGEIKFEMTAAS